MSDQSIDFIPFNLESHSSHSTFVERYIITWVFVRILNICLYMWFYIVNFLQKILDVTSSNWLNLRTDTATENYRQHHRSIGIHNDIAVVALQLCGNYKGTVEKRVMNPFRQMPFFTIAGTIVTVLQTPSF